MIIVSIIISLILGSILGYTYHKKKSDKKIGTGRFGIFHIRNKYSFGEYALAEGEEILSFGEGSNMLTKLRVTYWG